MKKSKFLVFLFVCIAILGNSFFFLGTGRSASGEISEAVYQAEDAVSDGRLIDDGFLDKQFSGKAYLLDAHKYIRFEIRAETTGFYRVGLAFCGYFEGKIAFDGSDSAKVYVNHENTELYSVSERMFLEAGTHRFEFVNSEKGYCGIDYLSVGYLEPLDASDVFDTDYGLSNPNATEKTKQLFEFIRTNYGKNIISGQNTNTGYPDGDFQRIKEKTGNLPAIMGLELQQYSPALGIYRTDTAIGYAQEYAALGGIVTLQWHWVAPVELLLQNADGTPQELWQGFRTRAVDQDKIVWAMTDKSGSGYRALMSDIDAIAVQLKRLADADVPVLFRPLHEASGGWFWWGLGGSEAYIDLWKTMYEKLTVEYRLNNLIWVWNGQSKAWYPGDGYVDIVGEDIYAEAKNYTEHRGKFAEVVGYSDSLRITALSECGVLIDIDKAFESKSVWSWFLNWNWIHSIPKNAEEIYATDGDGNLIYNTNVTPVQPYPVQTELEMWNKVYRHERVLTLKDSPFHSHTDNSADGICDVCGAEIEETSGKTDPLVIAVASLSVVAGGLIGTCIFLAVKLKK